MATANLGSLDDFPVGSMRLAKVGDHRIGVARTDTGVHAFDNACPHQGYGLVTGSLVGDLVTCQWHNWKFCVTDGTCVVGEENVASHEVSIDGGEVVVTVRDRSDEERREQLWPSLRRGLANNYVGQMARDAARLLRAGASPAEIVWEGVAHSAPRVDYGVGHEMANAADCLALAELFEGDERTLPVTQAMAGLAEEAFGFEPRTAPAGAPAPSFAGFVAAVEEERHDDAVALFVTAIENGAEPGELRHWLIDAVSRHHLDYGHGAIFVQKSCELLDRVGWSHAAELLPHMVTTIVYGTREDTLPYMRPSMRALATADLDAMAAASPATRDDGSLRSALLAAHDLPAAELAGAVIGGLGVEGLLDVVSLAASERLLRYDYTAELDPSTTFGWLDISHVLTYSNAARWAWRLDPGPHTARLALFAAWLAVDSGRQERRHDVVAVTPVVSGRPGDLVRAILDRRPDDAAAFAADGDATDVGAALARAALTDQSGSFIVAAHAVKMAVAAAAEARCTDSPLPLIATARFLAAPRQERFVASAAQEAIDFVRTGQPSRR
jgi:nitrite reductase/ring-hydroxylating ferredoxin subunit